MYRRGILYTIAAYVCWGMFPIYFHAMHGVGSVEILAHRIYGSLIFVSFLLCCLRRWSWLRDTLRSPKILAVFLCSALLIGMNWCTYVYTIMSGRALEASLGYFVNPLVSVALGSFFLKEKLLPLQKVAVAVAAAGVVWITVSTGTAPFFGLFLAISFAVYGLIRKLAPLGSLEGLEIESFVLTPIALGYIWWQYSNGTLAILDVDLQTQILVLLGGVLTTIPLILFATGVRMIPYTVVGIIQYLSPTICFFLSVFYLHEPFSINQLIGFACIWTAVILFTTASFRENRKKALEQPESTDNN